MMERHRAPTLVPQVRLTDSGNEALAVLDTGSHSVVVRIVHNVHQDTKGDLARKGFAGRQGFRSLWFVVTGRKDRLRHQLGRTIALIHASLCGR